MAKSTLTQIQGEPKPRQILITDATWDRLRTLIKLTGVGQSRYIEQVLYAAVARDLEGVEKGKSLIQVGR